MNLWIYMCITSKQKLALSQENYNTAVVARKNPIMRGCLIIKQSKNGWRYRQLPQKELKEYNQ